MMWVLLLILTAAVDTSDSPSPRASATRGITGTVLIELESGAVRGRPDLDLQSPLLVRVASVLPRPDGGTRVTLEFIGTLPGVYDLRDVLVFEDGQPINRIDAIPIEIISHLGDHAPSDLEMTPAPPSVFGVNYVIWLIAIGVIWIGLLAVTVTRRMLRRSPPVTPPTPPPTLADRLAPLVEAAAQGQLSIAQQGQLELMLYEHWRIELQLGTSMPEAVKLLRQHEEAGTLLRAVEGWLHDPRGHKPDADQIAQLLAPYRRFSSGEVTA